MEGDIIIYSEENVFDSALGFLKTVVLTKVPVKAWSSEMPLVMQGLRFSDCWACTLAGSKDLGQVLHSPETSFVEQRCNFKVI